uniref:Extracellular calcium-sensing receptor-like n=1 Tax=Erpetoichthys calabaricus TaxID=27687 RepID=A0A8C4TFB7_ERPCA
MQYFLCSYIVLNFFAVDRGKCVCVRICVCSKACVPYFFLLPRNIISVFFSCSLDYLGFQRAQTMIFAIEEINMDQTILPNITLGYRLYDNCMKLPMALRAATTLIAGQEDIITDFKCWGPPPVLAIVGDPGSTHSIAMSRMLSLFQMPMVSYYATCLCLSDKKEYPTFFRTIPSDAFQVKAMVRIIQYFGWTWVGAIASDDDYGQYAIKNFNEEIKYFGCIAFSETIPKVYDKLKITQIVDSITHSTAKVIVVFSSRGDLVALMKEVVRQNITGKQWIASEGWSTSTVLASKENADSFGGTIGIAIRRGEIPGLKKFLLQLQPDQNNNIMTKFWETVFECTFQNNISNMNLSTSGTSKACTGSEDLKTKNNAFVDTSNLRASYNVHKAVYALAHALHDLISCKSGNGPFENQTCANIKKLEPWQLIHYLKKVNFINHFGDRVTFDKNGDAPAIYDIINWHKTGDGSVTFKTVGVFDESATAGKELFLSDGEIFWNFPSGTVPESICSQSCYPGTRKATRKGQPVCCFDCVPCTDGEISFSIECFQCTADFWSNQNKTICVLKEVEFLSYEDAMGMTLAVIALLGACMSLFVLVIFMQYRSTPIVKANNSELSFLLLISLTFSFLSALCFIGQPSHWTCMLRHVLLGISLVVCISCILVKTIVVIMAFKATLPGNNMMKWFGVAQQRGTIICFTLIQALICTIWLSTTPPFPLRNTKYQNDKIIFECSIGSLIGFGCLLGYVGFLACISFLLAFLARHLPDTFNEAKFITFSMLIFCAVWITFIPAYISSPGKYTVAVEIFAILASSFGLLFAIFAPKCYIILLKPELNTKKAMMVNKNALSTY